MVFEPHFEWFFIDREGRAWIFRECILDANFTFFVARNCLPFSIRVWLSMDGEGQAWILANEILKQISRFSIVFAWFLNRISNGFSSIAKAERGFFANAFWMRISRFSWRETVYHFSCSNYRVAKLFSIFRRISFSSCHQKKKLSEAFCS